MRIIAIVSICLTLTLQAKTQSVFKSSFAVEADFLNPSKTIELIDSIGKSILTYNKDGLVFDNKKYHLIRHKRNIYLTDSLKKDSIGSIKRRMRSFSVDGIDYRISKRGRGGYNFVIKDKSNNIISFVKFSTIKNVNNIEILHKGNYNLLPFVFLVTLGELIKHKEWMRYLSFYYWIFQ